MASPLALSQPAPPEGGRGLPPSLLVVDDDPRNREVIEHFLAAEGWRVLMADGGEAALRTAAEQGPDLVLLDVMMPDLDGYEVCRRLKAEPATAYIPVVILTALRGVPERLKGAAAGADEFLSQPFDPVELTTRVRALLRTKQYHDRLRTANAELERRVAERTTELQQAIANLRHLDRMKSEFIANVSHELRTPLLHVKGYIDLLAEGALGELTIKQAEGLNVALEAIERLERLVDDVVDFSSPHEERLIQEPLYVADVCHNLAQSAGAAAAARRMSVALSLSGDAPRVLADRAALARVLRHLLDNAIKFGPPGQAIQISVERRGDRVRLAVRDQGPGLSPEMLAHIFDVFYQRDASITRRAGGLGVGLAVVKKLVEAHGSQVHVRSEPGRGSMFFFDLAAA